MNWVRAAYLISLTLLAVVLLWTCSDKSANQYPEDEDSDQYKRLFYPYGTTIKTQTMTKCLTRSSVES